MSAKDVIRQLAGSMVELLDSAGLTDDLREHLVEQILGGASTAELADSIISGVKLLTKMAA